MKFKYLIIILVFISEIIGNSQDNLKNEILDFQQLKWRWIAANMPVMRFLQDIISNSPEIGSLKISDENKAKAEKAYQNGIQCILKTQIVIDNKSTVWCAQHDEKTLASANARSYEL